MKRDKPRSIVLTCEHASNAVPARFRKLFVGQSDVLASHRGWDPGTLNLGRALQRRLSAPLFATTATRLLVETNRSLHHRQLFSEFTAGISEEERGAILAGYYWPHRNAVEQQIHKAVNDGQTVLHLSLHSFTPIMAGVVRNAEVGLLYDSRRKPEAQFCDVLRHSLNELIPWWRIRRNYPYLGRADGFTTHLRKLFGARDYLGIELELNQRLMSPANQEETISLVAEALAGLPGM